MDSQIKKQQSDCNPNSSLSVTGGASAHGSLRNSQGNNQSAFGKSAFGSYNFHSSQNKQPVNDKSSPLKTIKHSTQSLERVDLDNSVSSYQSPKLYNNPELDKRISINQGQVIRQTNQLASEAMQSSNFGLKKLFNNNSQRNQTGGHSYSRFHQEGTPLDVSIDL